jgi:predicted transglutaminase-like cysteine proteinase
MTLVPTPYSMGPTMWAAFCATNESECAGGTIDVIPFTPELLAELERVNVATNGRGRRTGVDCVWYTLEKRRVLMSMGYPIAALLPTVVQAASGAHMVLTVRTDQGEYVLDNFIYPYKVNPWTLLSKYRFVSRFMGTKPIWTGIADNRN